MLPNGKHIINNIIQIRIRRCIPPAPAHQIVRHGVDGGGAMVRQLESGKQPETRQPLQWYVAHTHNVLSVYDSRLATSDITTIHRMSRDQQRQLVEHLDIAQDAYTLGLRKRDHTQTLIIRYMVSTNKGVHNTLESDCKNDIETMGNNVIHDSLESNYDTQPNTYVRSTSAAQKDAQQKRTDTSGKKRGQ